MNTHQSQIAQIFETAQSSIQVAVSWFTDTLLIEKLIQKSKNVKVEVLLSSDKWNLCRHHHFRQLQHGAKVQKLGTENALLGNSCAASYYKRQIGFSKPTILFLLCPCPYPHK